MPFEVASRGLRITNGLPLSVIAPASWRYAPVNSFISVDLPAPFSPIRPTISFGLISMLTSSRASTPGKRLVMFFRSSMSVTHLTIRRCERSSTKVTATMISTPWMPRCTEGGTPSRTMPLASTTTMRVPTRAFSGLPLPPASEVPPTTMAAMATNSCPLPICPAGENPRHAKKGARQREHGDTHTPDPHAAETGQVFSAADGQRVATKQGMAVHPPCDAQRQQRNPHGQWHAKVAGDGDRAQGGVADPDRIARQPGRSDPRGDEADCQRGDERWNAQEHMQHAVDQAQHDTGGDGQRQHPQPGVVLVVRVLDEHRHGNRRDCHHAFCREIDAAELNDEDSAQCNGEWNRGSNGDARQVHRVEEVVIDGADAQAERQQNQQRRKAPLSCAHPQCACMGDLRRVWLVHRYTRGPATRASFQSAAGVALRARTACRLAFETSVALQNDSRRSFGKRATSIFFCCAESPIDRPTPPSQEGSQSTVATSSPALSAASPGCVPSMPDTRSWPASPSARKASMAPSAMSSLAAHTPLNLVLKRVSHACMMGKAFCESQSATWKSSSWISGNFFSAAIRPALRSMAGTLLKMPPSATTPPWPPMALNNSVAVAAP